MPLTTDALNATTTAGYIDDIKDNVFQKVAAYHLFASKGKVDRKGGVEVRQPILYKELAGGSYRGMDDLNTDEIVTEDYAVFQWKQLYKNATISNWNKLRNAAGIEQILDLVELKMDQLKLGMIAECNRQVWGLGTGNGGKDFDGIQAAVNTTSTYGGHAYTEFGLWGEGERAAINKWCSQNQNGQALSMVNWQLNYGRASFGAPTGAPQAVLMPQNVFNYLWNLFVTNQRIVDPKLGELGFNNLIINGIPNIVDDYAPAASAWWLNFMFFKLFIDPREDFSFGGWQTFINKNAVTGKLFLSGNLACGHRGAQSYATGITGLAS